MKEWFGVLCIGLLAMGCSQSGENGNDMGAQDLGSGGGGGYSTLSVVAGGVGGTGNADGIGTAARFNFLFGVTVDGAGNLFVADNGNCTIRKVVIATGVTTTLAGSPALQGSADGTGAAARFRQPYAVEADRAGNLYVADSINSTIRKIVIATGVVTTLAGMAGQSGFADGIGSAARFNRPWGMAFDGAGNLYVADENRTIRKVAVANGATTTVAGMAGMTGSTDGTGTAARFVGPTDVTLDGAGNLFVADRDGHTIRKIVLSTGDVTTIAGMGGVQGSADGTGSAARFYLPGGVEADGAGNLYVADSLNRTIRKIVLATGAVTTLVGTAGMEGNTDGTGAAVRFQRPWGMAMDAGDLYVADNFGPAIRKVVVSSGVTTTFAGSPSYVDSTDGIGAAARFFYPYGVTADDSGNLFVADQGNETIRKIVLSTGAVTTLAGAVGMAGSADGIGSAARFLSPYGLAADNAGNVYIDDDGNHVIRKLVVATGEVTTFAGMSRMGGCVDGIGTAARFQNPRSMVFDGAGNLYVADQGCRTIRKVVLASGATTTLAGMPGATGSADGIGSAARFLLLSGIALDGAGNLYIADEGNHLVRKLVLATAEVTTVAGAASMVGSTDANGTAARFNKPRGLAIGRGGHLYLADWGNSTLRQISLPSMDVTTLVGIAGQTGNQPGPLRASLNQPVSIVATADGTLYLADYTENVVLAVR